MRSPRVKEFLCLLAVMLFALAVRGLLLSKVEMVLPDEGYYIRMAEHLADGGSFADFGFMEVKKKGQPLVPYLFSWALRRGQDPIRTCQWISLMFSVLTLLPFHYVVRIFSPPREALLSGILYGLLPVLVEYSLWAMQHSVFNFFFITLLFFMLQMQSSPALRWPLGAGLAAWGLYMSRVEGILFAVWVTFAGGRKRSMLCFTLTWVLLSFPFWVWVRQGTGMWQLTWTDRLGAWGIFMNQWQAPLGPFGSTFFATYVEKLIEMYVALSNAVPVLLWVVIAFGLVRVFQSDPKAGRILRTFLLFILLPVLFYPAFKTSDVRFATPGLIAFLMFSGPGIEDFIQRVSGKLKWKGNLLRAFTILLMVFSMVPDYWTFRAKLQEQPLEQKEAGEWIKAHFSTPQILLGSDSRACFYAGDPCKEFMTPRNPQEALKKGESLESILDRAGVTMIAVDTRYGSRLFGEFYPLLQKHFKDRLRVIAEFTEGPEKLTLYELKRQLQK